MTRVRALSVSRSAPWACATDTPRRTNAAAEARMSQQANRGKQVSQPGARAQDEKAKVAALGDGGDVTFGAGSEAANSPGGDLSREGSESLGEAARASWSAEARQAFDMRIKESVSSALDAPGPPLVLHLPHSPRPTSLSRHFFVLRRSWCCNVHRPASACASLIVCCPSVVCV